MSPTTESISTFVFFAEALIKLKKKKPVIFFLKYFPSLFPLLLFILAFIWKLFFYSSAITYNLLFFNPIVSTVLNLTLIASVLIYFVNYSVKINNPNLRKNSIEIKQECLINKTKYTSLSEESIVLLKKVRFFFVITLSLLGLYYLTELIDFVLAVNDKDYIKSNVTITCVLNALNNASTLTFLFIYFVISKLILYKTSEIKYPKGAIVIILLVVILVISNIMFYVVNGIPSQKSSIHILLSISTGIFASIVVALFTSSINCKFEYIPMFYIISLFAYSIFLVLFPIISSHAKTDELFNILINIIYIIMFILKSIMFTLFIWLFKTQTLYRYVLRKKIYLSISTVD